MKFETLRAKGIAFTMAPAIIAIIGLSGCIGAKDGLAVNTVGKNRVDRYFNEGAIVEQKKVIIDDRELAILSGVGVGALGGAAAGSLNQNAGGGAFIGAALGGLVGAVVGNEVIAFETTIQSKDEKVVGFLKDELPLGTVVEYTLKDGKLKNVEVIKIAPPIVVEVEKEKIVEKVVYKDKIVEKEVVKKEVVEKVVYKDKTVEKPIKKTVEKPIKKTVEKTVENEVATTETKKDFWSK